jgi:hypothetical protein
MKKVKIVLKFRPRFMKMHQLDKPASYQGGYLNVSTGCGKNMSIISTEKDRIMK